MHASNSNVVQKGWYAAQTWKGAQLTQSGTGKHLTGDDVAGGVHHHQLRRVLAFPDRQLHAEQEM